MAKKKKTTPAIETVEQLHSTVDEIARLEVELRGLEADRDKAIQVVQEQHESKIEETKKRIKALMALSGIYSIANRAALFVGKLKSAASSLARFGFREGNPSLKTLNKKHTWDSVLKKLEEAGKTQFIRTKQEVNKEALQAAKLSDAELAGYGLRFDQGETFFVEPKSEEAKRLTEVTDQAA